MPGCLPYWVLRDFAALLCDPLCAIFNTSIRQAKGPAKWKHANVLVAIAES